MDRDHGEQFCVFFSNLEDDIPQSSLVTLIVSFIVHTTGIVVSERNVVLRHSGPCECNTAWVDLGDASLQRRTVEAAQKSNRVPKGLVKRGRALRVDYFRPQMQKPMSSSLPSRSPVPLSSSSYSPLPSSSYAPLPSSTPAPLPSPSPAPLPSSSPSPNLPLMRTDGAAIPSSNGIAGNPTTFSPATTRNKEVPRTHLVKDQRLGNETRILEFKRGGGDYVKKYMRRHLAKYVCAFLNSEGGTLMIGVDDEGVVQGVCCDHKTEDSLRIMIDQVIHFFDPPVLPQMYRLDFIPVCLPRNTEPEPNLKVVEITVKAGRPGILYETPEGEVFLRRDGSVQGPLRAKDIQEWCHMKFSREYQDKENTLRLQIDTLEVKLGNVEHQHSQPAYKSPETMTGASVDALPTTTVFSEKNSPKTEDSPLHSEPTNSLKRTNSKFCIIF